VYRLIIFFFIMTISSTVQVHSVIGCRVRNLGSYIHGGRVRNHCDNNNTITDPVLSYTDTIVQIGCFCNDNNASHSIKIRCVQFARILLYFTEIPRFVGGLGFRSRGLCPLSVYCGVTL